ncbi:carotenoid ester lipase precursor [Lactarius psammicola]|nr:carotenoid ester lipase precursor [Lactarius psammicola]
MILKHTALALSVAQALLTLASPTKPFAVQDSGICLASDHTNGDAESAARAPEVRLDDAVFVGIATGDTHQFLGIPFAYPPTGERRLRQPEATPPYSGLYYAQRFGRSCPQQKFSLPRAIRKELEIAQGVNRIMSQLYQNLVPDDEDCKAYASSPGRVELNQSPRPNHATSRSKLPVVVWIFGGGFMIGGPSAYNGSSVVSRSIDLNQPVIFVSLNYRLSGVFSNVPPASSDSSFVPAAFGFLPGKEVKEARIGNLGLQDQRLALKWVQTYITEFGGDPSKVTIWGESAGAISVSLHMLTNNGNQEGLFRGAIMQSGGPIPVGDIENGQEYYDLMVEETGCRNVTDTLACLRRVPYSTFKYAMDKSPDFMAYQGLVLAWLPRVDGIFLTEPPQHAVVRGHVSNVPMITGNCDDEATLFTFSTSNLTTTAHVKDYLKRHMMPRAKDSEIDLLLNYYPNDLRAGSPFDTGIKNCFYTGLASSQSWAFVFKRGKSVPFIGSAHATDLLGSILASDIVLGELRDYVIRFVNDLDPNGKPGLGIPWPQWDPRHPKAIILQDSKFFPCCPCRRQLSHGPLGLCRKLVFDFTPFEKGGRMPVHILYARRGETLYVTEDYFY